MPATQMPPFGQLWHAPVPALLPVALALLLVEAELAYALKLNRGAAHM